MPFFRRKRIDLRRNREIETNVWKHVLWGVLLIIGIILFVGAIWYVTRLPFVTLTTIHIEGGKTIPHELVETIVTEELRGSYLSIIPYTFALTYPHEKIIHAINSTPRIRDVAVQRTSRTELSVSFDEYVPYALWCLSKDEISECYFLDADGYAFSLAPPLRGGSLVRHIIEGKERLEEGQVLSANEFAQTERFTTVLTEQLGLRATHVTHTVEGDAIYHINGGGDLIVSTNADADATLTNLKAILESKEFKHLKPGNFKYIDLRFGKKIFVNEKLDTSTTTEAVVLPE